QKGRPVRRGPPLAAAGKGLGARALEPRAEECLEELRRRCGWRYGLREWRRVARATDDPDSGRAALRRLAQVEAHRFVPELVDRRRAVVAGVAWVIRVQAVRL